MAGVSVLSEQDPETACVSALGRKDNEKHLGKNDGQINKACINEAPEARFVPRTPFPAYNACYLVPT